MHRQKRDNLRGMTMVELLVAIGVLLVVFGGLMSSFQFALSLIGSSKAHAGALSLANQRMEYIRSLAYDDVGTLSGIPNGLIPQQSTTTLNGITYNERILIQYVDAPEDGTGADDENGILADYKRAKVEYSWDFRGEAQTVSLISNIIPRGIETTEGGGTLTVNVFDALVSPLQGASVRVYNDTGTSTIDVTQYTNENGVAMFAGAPALANYQITVTKADHSTDQTYTASSSNPNPTPPHVAVLEAEVSTMNFSIDLLSDLTVQTVGLPETETFEDAFTDSGNIAASSSVAVSSGEVTLSGAPGSYASQGSLRSTAVAPTVVDAWNTAFYEARVPLNTAIAVSVYDASGSSTPTLIPDTDLPGNSTGFAPGSIDLSGLDANTYPALALGGTLSTSDSATTSALLSWSLEYTISQPSIADVPFTLTIDKSIGVNGSTTVPKYEASYTTDSTGDRTLNDLEWGLYEVVVDDSSYNVAEACEDIPYSLAPGVEETLTLTLAPAVTHSLRVRVEDINGTAIPNADVTLSRTGFNESTVTSSCGGAFYNDSLTSANDYSLQVDATGYTTQTLTGVGVTGASYILVTMPDA